MPAKPIPVIAAELAQAADVAAALRTVGDELAATDKLSGFALLTYDARRELLVNEALGPSGDTAEHTSPPRDISAGSGAPASPVDHSRLALDHLPPTVRYAILAGQRFADVGDQASQYARLLGVDPAGTGLRLLLKGIVMDGALAAVLAAFDARRGRSANKLLERAEPLAALLELAFARFYEREARFEAVAALHAVTSRLRGEHASAVAVLDQQMERLRQAQRAGTSDVVRQLRDAVAAAERRAMTAEQRLAAVEAQVVNAVDRLERAHLQLAEQDAVLRASQETIRKLEQDAGISADTPS
jgi:hypothetical protein